MLQTVSNTRPFLWKPSPITTSTRMFEAPNNSLNASVRYNHGNNIFSLFHVFQISFSPQVKQSAIIINEHGTWEFMQYTSGYVGRPSQPIVHKIAYATTYSPTTIDSHPTPITPPPAEPLPRQTKRKHTVKHKILTGGPGPTEQRNINRHQLARKATKRQH